MPDSRGLSEEKVATINEGPLHEEAGVDSLLPGLTRGFRGSDNDLRSVSRGEAV